MQLWTWKSAQSMAEASKLPTESELPTPYQLSLLIGILLASPDRLRRYTSYRYFRQQRTAARCSPKTLVQAARMLYLCLAMAILMFAADTSVHYTTRTVQYDQVSVDTTLQTSGKALSQECLAVNRSANYGFPCSVNNLIPINQYLAQKNEMLYLYQNVSQVSEIRMVGSDVGDVALLLPKTQSLSSYVDFRASTIGVTTQCKPITPSCKFGVWGPSNAYSGFYCSPKFWGSLGEADTNASTTNQDYPPLGFKLSTNMM